MVKVLDPKTREDVARPLYEVATTHTARKTFIGNTTSRSRTRT